MPHFMVHATVVFRASLPVAPFSAFLPDEESLSTLEGVITEVLGILFINGHVVRGCRFIISGLWIFKQIYGFINVTKGIESA